MDGNCCIKWKQSGVSERGGLGNVITSQKVPRLVFICCTTGALSCSAGFESVCSISFQYKMEWETLKDDNTKGSARARLLCHSTQLSKYLQVLHFFNTLYLIVNH